MKDTGPQQRLTLCQQRFGPTSTKRVRDEIKTDRIREIMHEYFDKYQIKKFTWALGGKYLPLSVL